ncbi:hypothetical protein NMY22_g9479 [Coprinellus aureogranulatus]|nr:hypothetical protein NMY22_g9479 [Coprinellus aureogranulatus]
MENLSNHQLHPSDHVDNVNLRPANVQAQPALLISKALLDASVLVHLLRSLACPCLSYLRPRKGPLKYPIAKYLSTLGGGADAPWRPFVGMRGRRQAGVGRKCDAATEAGSRTTFFHTPPDILNPATTLTMANHQSLSAFATRRLQPETREDTHMLILPEHSLIPTPLIGDQKVYSSRNPRPFSAIRGLIPARLRPLPRITGGKTALRNPDDIRTVGNHNAGLWDADEDNQPNDEEEDAGENRGGHEPLAINRLCSAKKSAAAAVLPFSTSAEMGELDVEGLLVVHDRIAYIEALQEPLGEEGVEEGGEDIEEVRTEGREVER